LILGPFEYQKQTASSSHNLHHHHQQRRIYEQHPVNQTILAHGKNYAGTSTANGGNQLQSKREAQTLPRSESEIEVHAASSSRQLSADTKYGSVTNGIDRCSISRTRSNDQLLETTYDQSPYARKDLPLKQKSKSFESLGNDNEEEVSSCNECIIDTIRK